MRAHCLRGRPRMVGVLVVGVALGAALPGWRTHAAEPNGPDQKAAEAPASPATQAESPANDQSAAQKPFRGRLPAYYRYVVTEDQRQQIYKIQAEYEPRLGQLRAQLEALIAEQDAKVQAVLSPEQLKRVEQLREEARKAREARAAQKTSSQGQSQDKTSP